MCVGVYGCLFTDISIYMQRGWRTCRNLFSFYHVGPRIQTQIIKLDSKGLTSESFHWPHVFTILSRKISMCVCMCVNNIHRKRILKSYISQSRINRLNNANIYYEWHLRILIDEDAVMMQGDVLMVHDYPCYYCCLTPFLGVLLLRL